MPELKSLSPELLLHVSKILQVSMKSLVAVIELLDEGSTVPFIARYRKEATGNLDEVPIRMIEEQLGYFRDLMERKETILASIQEQGKLTDELKARIERTLDKSELEDLYCHTSRSGTLRRPSRARRGSSRWPIICGLRKPARVRSKNLLRLLWMRRSASRIAARRTLLLRAGELEISIEITAEARPLRTGSAVPSPTQFKVLPIRQLGVKERSDESRN